MAMKIFDLHMNSPLGRRLLRTVLSIYFVIAVSLTVTQLVLQFFSEKDRLIAEVNGAADTFSPIISSSLWSFDVELILTTLTSINGSDAIRGGSVENGEEVVAASGDVELKVDGVMTFTRLGEGDAHTAINVGLLTQVYRFEYDLDYIDDGETTTLGKLVMFTTSDVVVDRAMSTFIITIINASIKTLFLWVIFLIVLKKLIANPLQKLNDAIDALDPNSLETSNNTRVIAESDLVGNHDEISALFKSYITMEEELILKNQVLKDYQAGLEEKVRKRTKELRAKTEELEQISLAKSEFLSILSHEIRTPLNGVLGVSELLRETGLSSQQYRYLNIIDSSGEALLSILNNVLDYSKVEAGKLELESIGFNLEEIIDSSVAVFSATASKKGVVLLAGVDPKTPVNLLGDPTRLRQIIMNLIGNALKFTEVGEVVLRVTSLPNTDDNQRIDLRVQIQDTGIGMTKKQQDKLFKSFSQVDSSTTRRFGGTGLGLVICKKLVELMGGGIDVQSEVGVGTCFSIGLTLNVDAKGNADPPMTSLIGKKLLIVDDCETFLEIVSTLTKSWGMDVYCALDGDEAVRYINKANLSTTPFDIIFVDLLLTNTNGITLSKKISSELSPRSEIVLISGMQDLKRNMDLQDSGIKLVLEKPLTRRELYSGLVEVLGIRKSEAEVEQDAPRKYGNYKGVKVLVVDDVDVNLIIMSGMLKKLGIDPDCCVDGLKALERVQQSSQPYDIIYMDCEMPEMDGWQSTVQIRKFEKHKADWPASVIIGLSAHISAERKHKSELSGMNFYIEKPVTIDQIEQSIVKYSSSLNRAP